MRESLIRNKPWINAQRLRCWDTLRYRRVISIDRLDLSLFTNPARSESVHAGKTKHLPERPTCSSLTCHRWDGFPKRWLPRAAFSNKTPFTADDVATRDARSEPTSLLYSCVNNQLGLAGPAHVTQREEDAACTCVSCRECHICRWGISLISDLNLLEWSE